MVVGAGPSGSSASRSASLEGADTLLLEKKKKIGVPIRCGEFIPSLNETRRLLPRAKALMKFTHGIYDLLSDDAVSNRTTRIRLYSPKNRSYEFDFDGIVLNREVFEKILVRKAEKSGVTLRTSAIAKAISPGDKIKKVLVRSSVGETFIRAKLLIGADGFPSNVGKWAHLNNPFEAESVVLCAQQRMKDVKLDEDVVEIYFSGKYAPGGYAWIIPKGEREANVGVGVRLSYLRKGKGIVEYLDAFSKKHPVASKRFPTARATSLIVKMVPVGGLVPNLCGNRTLLVGDAGGMVIAINGCGIPPALVSGHLAGKTASQHLRGDCGLSAYVTDLRREIGDVLERGLMYRKVADWLMRRDDLFEKVLQIIGVKSIAKVIKCEPI